ISEQSLQKAKQSWEEVFSPANQPLSGGVTETSAQHRVKFLPSFAKIPKQVDIAVIATIADVRPKVVKQITTNNEVRYWILEKVLAQSVTALDELLSLTKNSAGAWTNIPRRMMVWHQQIREQLRTDVPLHITGRGSLLGLACNGIHYLDLVAWWTGETLNTIDISGLDSQWIESKRMGFLEITGKIAAFFSGGTTFSLESKLEGPPLILKVEGKKNFWEIDEQNGVLSGPNGLLITGKNEMQSLMTTRLVDTLLTDGYCDLPKLSDSVEMHRVYLRSLLEHWNNVHGSNVDVLPIT
ncbi:uncharacterized protein METZ01_LOCUS364413, partial [marine metagenome]